MGHPQTPSTPRSAASAPTWLAMDWREHGLLRDTTTFVHANEISDEELWMLARRRQFGVDQPGRRAEDGIRIADDRPGAHR